MKLKYDNLLSSFAFKFNLRRYDTDITLYCWEAGVFANESTWGPSTESLCESGQAGGVLRTSTYAVRAPLLLINWGVQCVYTGFRDTVRHPADRFQCLLELLNPRLYISVIYLPVSESRGDRTE